jgi:hypothetical protein
MIPHCHRQLLAKLSFQLCRSTPLQHLWRPGGMFLGKGKKKLDKTVRMLHAIL